ncbi:ATP-binding protein [Amycolatopsis magusensis]|uniref:ATP-binding protein n=1 Tax=Amycolatopsis magusensis TaxID=882444 RepID=UPI00378B6C46
MDSILSAEGPVTAVLPADLTAEGEARRFVSRVLSAWRDTLAFEDATLIASELVANVVRHAGGKPTLSITTTAGGIRIECEDGNPAPPRPKLGGPEGGWGLALVERLSQRWGVQARDAGKVVWCELPLPPMSGNG